MCVQNIAKILVFSSILALFCGCEAVENIIPSTGTYKIGTHVNGIPLDECSFVNFNDEIQLYFEEKIINDPDVTSLMVFLRNSNGDFTGWRVVYTLTAEKDEDETDTEIEEEDEDIIILVKSLNELPLLLLPDDLPIGRYTIISQAMSGKEVLQRTENIFFYLGSTDFSFNDVSVNLPGITESQLIPKGLMVMLEANLVFDSSLDPYIVWSNGRRVIKKGHFSEGAGQVFWKAPEQSGFYSLYVEVFPISDYGELAGYQKEVSLLVSPMPIDVHLISEDIPQLFHWYIFEGNLNDSKMISSEERNIKPAADNDVIWAAFNGTYGLITGCDNMFELPKVSSSSNDIDNSFEPLFKQGTWQTLFRFLPINDGKVFSVIFGSSGDISLDLNIENKKFVLTFVSPFKNVSKSYNIPQQDTFITSGVSFSILPGMLSAKINIMGESVDQNNSFADQINLEVNINDEFQIILGFMEESKVIAATLAATLVEVSADVSDEPFFDEQLEILNKPIFTALWDEFALYYMPPMDVIAADVKPAAREEQLESEEL